MFTRTPSFTVLTMERVGAHQPFYTKGGEGLKNSLAITKSKSLSIYYKFTSKLIYLTKFLCGMLSSSISLGHTSQSDGLANVERWVRSSRMPHAGYADSIMNNGPRFHSNISGKSSPDPSLEPSW